MVGAALLILQRRCRGRGGGPAPPPRGPAGRRSGRRPLKPPGGRLGCAPVPAAFAGHIPAQGAFL